MLLVHILCPPRFYVVSIICIYSSSVKVTVLIPRSHLKNYGINSWIYDKSGTVALNISGKPYAVKVILYATVPGII
ncbi:hypothetical protein DWY28_01520 [Ruminococcus sp. AF24-32LB]|nr:hypothetical protein DWY28_01520 [Ruminococcus sp. AF24-32LB]